MRRIEAVKRSKATSHQGHPTWDIKHVWPDGWTPNGVRWGSTVHCYVAQPVTAVHDGKQVKVRVWVPGGPQGDEVKLGWGDEFWAPVGGFGMASFVSEQGVELDAFWELAPGKPG